MHINIETQNVQVMIDAPVLTVTFNSDTELVVVVASQDSFKDPRHLAALSALTEKKSVIVENPDGRKAALLDAFELTIDFNIDALTGFIDLMVRNPLNTALVGIACAYFHVVVSTCSDLCSLFGRSGSAIGLSVLHLLLLLVVGRRQQCQIAPSRLWRLLLLS